MTAGGLPTRDTIPRKEREGQKAAKVLAGSSWDLLRIASRASGLRGLVVIVARVGAHSHHRALREDALGVLRCWLPTRYTSPRKEREDQKAAKVLAGSSWDLLRIASRASGLRGLVVIVTRVSGTFPASCPSWGCVGRVEVLIADADASPRKEREDQKAAEGT